VGNITVPAVVPGEIQTDLMAAGVLQQDPYAKYNDVEYRWVVWMDWHYSRQFTVTQQQLNEAEVSNLLVQYFLSLSCFNSQNTNFVFQILLVCYGVDTVSTILINGQVVGTTDNQFRRYIFSIKHALVLGANNRIEVRFQSAGTYADQKAKAYPYPLNESTSKPHSHGELYRHFMRKESCSFAWDWGPCFMPQGIWRPIEIIGHTSPLLIDAYPQVFNEKDGAFRVLVSADVSSILAESGVLTATVAGVQATAPFTLSVGSTTVTVELSVPAAKVDLW